MRAEWFTQFAGDLRADYADERIQRLLVGRYDMRTHHCVNSILIYLKENKPNTANKGRGVGVCHRVIRWEWFHWGFWWWDPAERERCAEPLRKRCGQQKDIHARIWTTTTQQHYQSFCLSRLTFNRAVRASEERTLWLFSDSFKPIHVCVCVHLRKKMLCSCFTYMGYRNWDTWEVPR